MDDKELIDTSVEVDNIESLLQSLEAEHEMPYHNSFLDMCEQELMDDRTYHNMQLDKYGYVTKLIDDFF